jgi:hypothetical protein
MPTVQDPAFGAIPAVNPPRNSPSADRGGSRPPLPYNPLAGGTRRGGRSSMAAPCDRYLQRPQRRAGRLWLHLSSFGRRRRQMEAWGAGNAEGVLLSGTVRGGALAPSPVTNSPWTSAGPADERELRSASIRYRSGWRARACDGGCAASDESRADRSESDRVGRLKGKS